MLILNSRDAALDARAFDAAGIGGFDVFDFAREGKRPDGAPVKLAFSLAFAADPVSPHLRFAACQHHFPQNFWDPAFQTHANSAKNVVGVAMVASNPAGHHHFLRVFTDAGELHSSAIGVKARTENGDIEILGPLAYRDQFGVSVELAGEGMILNAMRFAVADMAQIEALHRQNGIGSQRLAGRLVVPPDLAHGATLIFETA